MTTPTEVPIAGVLWPVYKLVALAVGLMVLVVVGMATASLGPAVTVATSSAAVVWLALGLFRSPRG
jgi:hypothetical protein